MKKVVLLSVISGAAILGITSVSFSQRQTVPRPAVSRWEYCRVTNSVMNSTGDYGVSVSFANQSRFTPFPKNKSNLETIVSVVNQLGAQGWEIVSERENGYTLKRRK